MLAASDDAATRPAAVILAGGGARRLGGGDKCLLTIGGVSLLQRTLAILRPQAAPLALNAHGDPARFKEYDLPVLADAFPGDAGGASGGGAGPLAGVLTAMLWLRRRKDSPEWLLTVPGDAPFLPTDLAARLTAARRRDGADIAVAASGGRRHPVVALWPVLLADALESALSAGVRKIDQWTAAYRVAVVEYSREDGDPFLNINTPQDLAAARARLAGAGGDQPPKAGLPASPRRARGST